MQQRAHYNPDKGKYVWSLTEKLCFGESLEECECIYIHQIKKIERSY